MMEWWQRVEGWQMLANRKVPIVLGLLYIAQEPPQDVAGALKGLSLLLVDVLGNMLEVLQVVWPTYGFGRRCFHELPE